ncbi:DUF2840 domain-containing protein [Agrobacterium tumefaciens]|uniref:DUF2840 domain-containing protein n=1 Tax=Agrobacterium tumefaciens TaxID=358 RepID=UPI0021CFE4F5|nr:DUF2840 domain-containing protein [Agrobacterium tumefaciens]UXS53071.1 DUF2840 domain-containing protein [Agrobacterium tumefaciens]UXS63315.1 DUF2840 domain-containing protein [Agrobacterium tumefaciens]
MKAESSSPRTLVHLTWRESRIEQRIRFGRIAEEQRIDRHRRVVGFEPGAIFAFVRWAANEYGTVVSRIDILCAVASGERYQTLPLVHPGGEILLRIHGWPKVRKVLDAIDAIERLGIHPADVAPDHWRHIHNRLTAGEPFRAYSQEQHRDWLKRRRVEDHAGRGGTS